MSGYQISLERPPQVAWIGRGNLRIFPFERYLLPDLWCIHLFGDPITLHVGEAVFEIKQGDATLIPPATTIEFHFPAPTSHWHLYAHFRLESDENPLATPTLIPSHQALGARFEPLCARLEGVMSALHLPAPHAQAQLWSVLWEMARRDEQTALDPLISRAQTLIEERMAQPLSVAGLARELGVSHNHLTCRFRAQTGQTVVGFIREARLTRARHLLRHSTLPIKAIASQVGLGDFHSFGKALRRADGLGPRAMRSRSLANRRL